MKGILVLFENVAVQAFARSTEVWCSCFSLLGNLRSSATILDSAFNTVLERYLGKAFTVDQIDALDNSEIEKLYAHYEARLGAVMTKMLRFAVLHLYARIKYIFPPIPAENQPALIADLEGDLFVGHTLLSSATCQLYHRHGIFLAPLTAALTTAKYCRFGHQCPVRITSINNDGEQADGGEPTRSRDGFSGGASTKSVERVTDHGQKVKDPRKEAARRASAEA